MSILQILQDFSSDLYKETGHLHLQALDIEVNSSIFDRLANELGYGKANPYIYIQSPGGIIKLVNKDYVARNIVSTPSSGSTLPLSGAAIQVGLDTWKNVQDNIQPPCSHEYVDVGFMHSKLVCKHCNGEK